MNQLILKMAKDLNPHEPPLSSFFPHSTAQKKGNPGGTLFLLNRQKQVFLWVTDYHYILTASAWLFFGFEKMEILATIAVKRSIKSWITPKLTAAVVPIRAHNVGIITRYFEEFFRASIKNPKVVMVVGHGNPNEMVFTNESTSK